MLSNQIIQKSLDELKAVTKVDLEVYDLEGIRIAGTIDRAKEEGHIVNIFADSVAQTQELENKWFMKIQDEGQDILSRIDARTFVIALCIEGKQLSSEELAEKFREIQLNSYSTIAFIIGSSHGLSDEVKKRANLKLSFSKMTFPHQLMRVVLAEQIYRAFSIINGTKYHK